MSVFDPEFLWKLFSFFFGMSNSFVTEYEASKEITIFFTPNIHHIHHVSRMSPHSLIITTLFFFNHTHSPTFLFNTTLEGGKQLPGGAGSQAP